MIGFGVKGAFLRSVSGRTAGSRANQSPGWLSSETTRGTFQSPMPDILAPAQEVGITWVFDQQYVGETKQNRVRNVQIVTKPNYVFSPASTSVERGYDFTYGEQILAALDAPLTGVGHTIITQSGSTFQGGPYNIVQTKVYDPSEVSAFRIRVSNTFVSPIPDTFIRHLYLRLMEMPINEQGEGDDVYVEPELELDEERTVDGLEVYTIRARELCIIPSSSLAGLILQNGDLLKPRPTWGDTWLKMNVSGLLNPSPQDIKVLFRSGATNAGLWVRQTLNTPTWFNAYNDQHSHLFTLASGDFMGPNGRYIPIIDGPENDWEPEVAGVDVGFSANFSNYTAKWMGIPLTESFDEVITIPTFTRKFVVQAFFFAPIYTDLFPVEDESGSVTLKIRPA